MSVPTHLLAAPHAASSVHRTLRCAVLGLLTFGALAGCKKAADAPEATEVPVQAEKAEVKPITEYIAADTVLSPLSQAAIVPKIAAPVQRFLVQRGAHVKKGQLLAVLQNADLAAQVQDTRGALSQADASYTSTTQAGVVEDRQKAQLDVAQAKATLDVQQKVVDARTTLLQQGAIPKRDLDTAQASLVQAQAAYDIAQQHLTSLTSVSQAATIKNAAGALESARGKYQAAQAGLSFSEIRSPIDGVITDRPLFAGEMPNQGQAVLTVMDLSSLIAKVHLSQQQAAALKLGASAKVTIPGLADPVDGKVSLISPALDPGTTTLEVWVQINNRRGAYKEGTPVHVSLAARTVQDAVAVPNEAIVQNKAGNPAVMVIGPDSTAHQKDVKAGITDGHDTQILSGIAAGDTVITTGAYGMDDGTKVKIAAAGEADEDKGAATDEKSAPAGKSTGKDAGGK
ncbi:MAG: efflux RND transporter periplasmic adaptor subunit [Acidobacteriota bacterium]|nr:efflux RND transporter periplasmic adaptor subunit [Acidobacteriota bacterium]